MKDLPKISLSAKKLFNIVSLSNKKTLFSSLIYGVIAIILIAGILLFNTTEKQINSQKTELATLQQTIRNNNKEINTLSKKNASESAQITALMNRPTPTPVVETQYVSQTSTQNNNPSDSPIPASDTDNSGNTATLPQSVVNSIIKNAFDSIGKPSTSSTCRWTIVGDPQSGMTCTSD